MGSKNRSISDEKVFDKVFITSSRLVFIIDSVLVFSF